MADIDMIPRSYRDGVRLRRTVRQAACALAAVVIATAAGHAALRWSSAAMEREATLLRSAASAARSDLQRATAQREAALREQQRAGLLGAVRREGELAAFARAIDSALPADTWLTALALRRSTRVAPPGAALPSSGGPQNTFATGNAQGDTLLLDSHVELDGQAASYEGMTDFLAKLGRIPGLENLQLQSSSVNAEAGAIDFRATLSLTRRQEAE
ncbi:PilN domain-containing protein [Telluria beijingensis]|uniref:PilN domain-containing protein n=1 Tax=Telluria beijingensis TaxID=3068633 RepID=UPI0027954A1A|nr:PilN domain-containing protein [Massilia sp. REN29]